MGKHGLTEEPMQRLDRLINELRGPDRGPRYPRHHATDNRWHERLAQQIARAAISHAIAVEYLAMPTRYLLGATNQ